MASRRDSRMTLTPTGPPPESRGWGWCPRHAEWVCTSGSRLCNYCRTPLARLPQPVTPRAGELRPGIVAEFADRRDDLPGLSALGWAVNAVTTR